MKLCKQCNSPMVHIFSFSLSGNEKFFRCSNIKCRSETKHTKIQMSELGVVKREYIHK